MRTAQIKQLFRIIGGKPAPKGDNVFSEEGTPFIKMKDLGRAHFSNNLIDIAQRVSDSVAKKERLNLIRRGSILLPRSGSVALNHRAVLGIDAYMVSHICALEVIDQTKVSNLYAYYYLRSIKMDSISKKTTGLDAITFEDLGKLSIPLPSIDDQIRIAHLLGKVEELIVRRKQYLQQLDGFLKSVFLEMFGDPVRNDKGWDTKTLPQLVQSGKNSLKRGPFGGALKKEIFVESGYLVYEQNHALNNDYSFARYFVTEEKYQELLDFKVVPGDVLISCSGVYLGKLSIVPADALPGIINQALLKVSLDPTKIERLFFVHVFGSPQFKEKYFPSNRGGAIPNLPPMSVMKEIPFIYPPINLQKEFTNIYEKVDMLKSHYKQSLDDLEALYGALSQQAFKGELDLSRVPLPSIQANEENAVPSEPLQHPEEQAQAIHLPDTNNLLEALKNPDGRQILISHWLESYRSQTGNLPFSVKHFMAAAQTRLSELHPDNDFELGASDYDHIKEWVFKALATGMLTQEIDSENNQVFLKPRSAE